MKLGDVINGLTIISTNADLDMEISGVSYDSRKTEAGDLFVAVTGFVADGHKFIPTAKQKGAVAVLVEHVPEEEIAYVQVASTRTALAKVGENWYDHPAEKMKIIGVTGTNGKTTVTFLLKNILESVLKTKVGLIGTIQNMIGEDIIQTERTTPESFELQGLFAQMAAGGCTHVVMEVSSHALTLHRVDGIHFMVGAFTNLTEDHLDFHKTMDAYAQAKAVLFQRCDVGIFNVDDDFAGRMMQDATCQIVKTSVKSKNVDLCAQNVELAADHVAFDVVQGAMEQHFMLGIPGEFMVYNALTVIGVALQLGISMQMLAQAMARAQGVKGRVEVVPTPGKDFTVLIDYAHTPDGLENILSSVRRFCKGRTIAVFGCGGDRDPIKRPIMGQIGVTYADLAVITTDNARTEVPAEIIKDILKGVAGTQTPYVTIEDRGEAIRWAMDHAQKDDIIVLCGKGHETYQILGTERIHLDEREVVSAHLREMNK